MCVLQNRGHISLKLVDEIGLCEQRNDCLVVGNSFDPSGVSMWVVAGGGDLY